MLITFCQMGQEFTRRLIGIEMAPDREEPEDEWYSEEDDEKGYYLIELQPGDEATKPFSFFRGKAIDPDNDPGYEEWNIAYYDAEFNTTSYNRDIGEYLGDEGFAYMGDHPVWRNYVWIRVEDLDTDPHIFEGRENQEHVNRLSDIDAYL